MSCSFVVVFPDSFSLKMMAKWKTNAWLKIAEHEKNILKF